ncbi:MAG: hypothetical protein MMC33_003261 [Icmadophila ericetorum]|nr:hypothetical protein [Icmadophila ericetorum]
MAKVQFGPDSPPPSKDSLPAVIPISLISGIILPGHPPSQLHDIHISPSAGLITHITPHSPVRTLSLPENTITATQCLALPSLCHPHIHLDKAHLHSHPLYSSLRPQSGTFAEALSLTSRAKKLFTREDLLQRGEWLIAESIAAGVTHMRAFVEADAVAESKGLEAGLELKRRWKGRCELQICVFAQEVIFTGSEGEENRVLVERAVEEFAGKGVDVLGSTPYVEGNEEMARKNVEWVVRLAMMYHLHLDLHLDYNLDAGKEALVWWVLEVLRRENWAEKGHGKTVCLGHCTRLTLFEKGEWARLEREAGGLRISFVGLPTSDLYMMGRPRPEENWRDRGRGTLQVPWLIKEAGINAVIGVNNVGNAFTSWGSPDPMGLASLGVGIYQAGTEDDSELLYAGDMVSCQQHHANEIVGVHIDPGQRSNWFRQVVLEVGRG